MIQKMPHAHKNNGKTSKNVDIDESLLVHGRGVYSIVNAVARKKE